MNRGHATAIQWGPAAQDWGVTRVTAPDGSATVYAYTPTPTGDRVLRTVVTNAREHAMTYELYGGIDEKHIGSIERVPDPLGRVTRYAYDVRRNLTEVI